MPLYEYRCDRCQRKFTLYLPKLPESPPNCPQCSGATLKRVFSTFSVQKSHQAVYEDILSDNKLTRGLINNDPKALAEWNKRMSGGEKVTPEYEETLGRMEHGEMPQAPAPPKKEKSTKAKRKDSSH